jgi:hypothetical protein
MTLAILACNELPEAPVVDDEPTPEPILLPTGVEGLESPAPAGARFPRLVQGPDGDVILSWLRTTEAGAVLEYAPMLDDGSFGAVQTIVEHERLLVNWADGGSVRIGRNHWVANWLQSVAGGYHAFVSRSVDGRTWSPGVRLHDFDGRGEYGFVVPLPQDDGTTVFAWLDARKWADDAQPDEQALMTRVMDASGTLGPESVLDSRVCDCCPTSGVQTGTGAIITYRDRTEAEIRDIAVVIWDGTSWGDPVIPSPDGWEIAGCPVNGPSVVSNGEPPLLTWTTSGDGRTRVQSVRLNADGSRHGEPFVIASGDGVIGRVDSLISEAGALITWVELLGDDTVLRARWLRSNDVLEETFDIGILPGGRASGTPRILEGPTGILVAWTQPTEPPSLGLGVLR